MQKILQKIISIIMVTIFLFFSSVGFEGSLFELFFMNHANAAAGSPQITLYAGGKSVFAKSDSGEVGWGYNYYGNLGLGYFGYTYTPVEISGLRGVKELIAGDVSGYALLENGTVMAWGYNYYGQLGIGNTQNQYRPVQISGLTGVKHIYARYYHAFALLENGAVMAWGYNGNGQLGIGNTTNQSTPVAIPGLSNVKEITVGYYHSMALLNDGTVKAWGYNNYGQLGIGNNTDQYSPVTVSSLSGVSKITTGQYHSMALMSNGTVKAWGNNEFGQLGIGNTNNYNYPVNPNLSDIKEISAGYSHSVALTTSGAAYGWGYNGNGQLGLGNTNNQLVPVQIPNLTTGTHITTGSYNTFVSLNDGTVKACGNNGNGQLGIGNIDGQLSLVNIPELTGCTQIVAGSNFVLALKPDKTVLACGNNSIGQLGIANEPNKVAPVLLESFSGMKEIAVGSNYSIILMEDGTVKACGYNANGQLGLGDKNNRNLPIPIAGLTNVVKLAAGYNHSIALMQDGTVKAWGNNGYGQLGIGNTVDQITPISLSGLTNVKDLANGYYYSVALLNDGTVKAWGNNGYGQLGNGDRTQQNIPKTVSGLSNVKKVVSGAYYTVALLNDGTVKAWGDNGQGQLGIGNTTNQYTPVVIPNLSGVKDIAAGGQTTMALMQDGTVKAWGYNLQGQLGINSTINQSTPVTIPNLSGVVQLVLSSDSAYAVLNNETILSWGQNSSGQLGLGDLQDRLVPTLMPIEFTPPIPSFEGIFIHTTENSLTISDSKNKKDKNVFRFTLGTQSTDWLDATAFPDQVTHTFDVPSPNTAYSVKVEIKNMSGEMVEKTYSIATKAQTPAFTTLCENPTELKINIDDNNPNETDYQIQVDNQYVLSTGSLSVAEQWIKLTNKTITVTGLQANKAYQLRIRARNKDGIETEFTALQQTTTPIQAPQNIQATPQSDSISISWDEVPGATSYEVEADGIVYGIADNLYFTHTGLVPATSHVYRIRAKNSQYTGEWSSELVAETKNALPPTPTNLTLNSTSTTITASWSEVPGGGVVYQLEVDGKITETGFNNKYQHINLATYSRHTYRVRAVNSTGASPWSTAKAITTAFLPPASVEGLSATESMTKIVITWGKVLDASSYVLQIDGKEIDNGQNTYWIIYGKPDTSYTFKVKAKNSAGESDWREIAVRTYSLETPIVNKITESQHEVMLTWKPVQNAFEYKVERNGQIVGTVTDISFTDTDLTAETKYIYRIKAVGQASKESNFSSPMEAITLPEKPAIPTQFYVGGSNGLIVISWDSVSDAIGYDLEIDGVVIDNGDDTLYKYKDVFAKTTHTYRVRARNSGIEGDWHEGVSFTTLPDTIQAPENIAVETTSTITKLSWQPAPDAIKYEVEVDGAIVYSGARTDYSHRRIQPNTEHVYRVRSIGDVQESEWSDTIVNNAVKVVCEKGKNVQIGLAASDVTDFSGYTLTVVYNKDVLDVTDLCTLTTTKELTIGKIKVTDVEVVQFEPGKIVFKVDKPIELGKTWSGIINRIGFNGRVTGGTTITYTVFIEPKQFE